jgi:hypothetical protein
MARPIRIDRPESLCAADGHLSGELSVGLGSPSPSPNDCQTVTASHPDRPAEPDQSTRLLMFAAVVTMLSMESDNFLLYAAAHEQGRVEPAWRQVGRERAPI